MRKTLKKGKWTRRKKHTIEETAMSTRSNIIKKTITWKLLYKKWVRVLIWINATRVTSSALQISGKQGILDFDVDLICSNSQMKISMLNYKQQKSNYIMEALCFYGIWSHSCNCAHKWEINITVSRCGENACCYRNVTAWNIHSDTQKNTNNGK